MGVEPTRSDELDLSSRYRHRREQHLWCWSTDGLVDSTNHLDHLSAIFAQLSGKERVLDELRNQDCETSISVYWDFDGQGGPWLDIATINALSRFQLEVWWDIYVVPDEAADLVKPVPVH